MNWVGPDGNITSDNDISAFDVILKISNIMLILTLIVLALLYYIFYFKSNVSDLIHIVYRLFDTGEGSLYRCYNVSVISDNLKEMYSIIENFIDNVKRY
ncbi:hypothetical protein [uncultured Ruminococcus sp.]|jgi:hypothetical protein|uniref:hypothetical protein n=1 Tax=uncultured Ruminococcus sp. TaxID=165186 RepID=UPI00266D00F7|nr:hypothetical protein [uncultured Ruminococcus sp.]